MGDYERSEPALIKIDANGMSPFLPEYFFVTGNFLLIKEIFSLFNSSILSKDKYQLYRKSQPRIFRPPL
jgi:hypothetical protein